MGRKKLNFANRSLMVTGILAALIMLPTTIVLCVGLLPSFIAALTDKYKGKTKAIAVGFINLAGCSPYLFELWLNGNSFEKAIFIVTNPGAIVVMYSAAVAGYMLDWAMTGLVATLMLERAKARQEAIKEEQKMLIERWGKEVTGEIPLDQHGFSIAKESKFKK